MILFMGVRNRGRMPILGVSSREPCRTYKKSIASIPTLVGGSSFSENILTVTTSCT